MHQFTQSSYRFITVCFISVYPKLLCKITKTHGFMPNCAVMHILRTALNKWLITLRIQGVGAAPPLSRPKSVEPRTKKSPAPVRKVPPKKSIDKTADKQCDTTKPCVAECGVLAIPIACKGTSTPCFDCETLPSAPIASNAVRTSSLFFAPPCSPPSQPFGIILVEPAPAVPTPVCLPTNPSGIFSREQQSSGNLRVDSQRLKKSMSYMRAKVSSDDCCAWYCLGEKMFLGV